MRLPYSPIRSQEQLQKIFSKMRKAPYNRFFWYRLYIPKKEPLCKRSCLERKVENGDFDYSHYKYQAEYVEHNLNKAYAKYFPDIAVYNEQCAVDIRRREKLLETFIKDEDTRLSTLVSECSIRFKKPKQDIEELMLKSQGDVKQFLQELINQERK